MPGLADDTSAAEYRPLLFSIAYGMTGSVGDAEDIVQDAFLGLTRARQAGTPIEAHILGDPAGDRTEQIVLPKQTGNFDYFSGGPGEHPPSPNVLRVSPYPNVLAREDQPGNVAAESGGGAWLTSPRGLFL